MRTETYTLPSFWASALINDDVTGWEDDEEAALDDWLLAHPQLGLCIGVAGEAEFRWRHDASEYIGGCDCSEFTFELKEST